MESHGYLHYIELPLKLGGCWEWYPKADKEHHIILNNIYLCFVLFALTQTAAGLCVYLYTEWKDIMSSLDQIADFLPLLASLIIVAYYAMYKQELYKLIDYMNGNFKYRSARGLTNMTMLKSYETAKKFAKLYTACSMFSVTMYATLPLIFHLWTKEPIQSWSYMDVTRSPYLQIAFLNSLLGQLLLGLTVGQFGVFFAVNSILICGQLDLVCCSLRNARYTAVLHRGVLHHALVRDHEGIVLDELHHYLYNEAVMEPSEYHYDKKIVNNFENITSSYDIYTSEYEEGTMTALRECAAMCQVINNYKESFERFVSPLLVVRVVQVTLYLCTLLYAATVKLDTVTVEYLAAVSLDIFIYCYYGNQIIAQAERVSSAAYTGAWPSMGVRARRLLLNLLLANRRPSLVRAGRFLPMDLHTFVIIIKTSFSYYTLLVNVNEKK